MVLNYLAIRPSTYKAMNINGYFQSCYFAVLILQPPFLSFFICPNTIYKILVEVLYTIARAVQMNPSKKK